MRYVNSPVHPSKKPRSCDLSSSISSLSGSASAASINELGSFSGGAELELVCAH